MLNNMGDELKKLLLLGIGAAALTVEKCADAKTIIDDLVKKGELSVEQGKILNEELKHNVKDKWKETMAVKKKEELLEQLKQMDPEEWEALKQQIETLQKKDRDDGAC